MPPTNRCFPLQRGYIPRRFASEKVPRKRNLTFISPLSRRAQWSKKQKPTGNFGGHFISGFFKWAAVALVVGAVGGVVGNAFYSLVNGAADFRARYPFMLYFLPLFGLLIAHLYRINGMSDNGGTNQVISSVRDKITRRWSLRR